MKEETPAKNWNAESREIWDANAGYWDDHMGDAGNAFHRELVAPAAEKLLALRDGESVLEIACGAGLFARRMAELGAIVTATDFSPAMIERARKRTEAVQDRITFRLLDATDPGQLGSLPSGRYDAVVCNMAIMDIAEIDPLFAAVSRVLAPDGRFVFTICHPCFNTSGADRVASETDSGGHIAVKHSLSVNRYRTLGVETGIGIKGQPRPQYYFHRTLADLLGAAFHHGLMMDGIEEPYFGPPEPGDRALGMRHFTETPMLLGVRLRVDIRRR